MVYDVMMLYFCISVLLLFVVDGGFQNDALSFGSSTSSLVAVKTLRLAQKLLPSSMMRHHVVLTAESRISWIRLELGLLYERHFEPYLFRVRVKGGFSRILNY